MCAGFWWGETWRKEPLGRPGRSREFYIKIELKARRWDGVDWINVAEGTDVWRRPEITPKTSYNKDPSVPLSTTRCDIKEFNVPFVWLSAGAAINSLYSILCVPDAVLETAIVQTASACLSVLLSARLCVSRYGVVQKAVFFFFFFFFFFHWYYSPLWALAYRTMSFNFFLSLEIWNIDATRTSKTLFSVFKYLNNNIC